MKMFKITNLDKYQHYKDRKVVWVKLFISTLSDWNFLKLTDDAKLHFLLLVLLGSSNNNALNYDKTAIKRMLHLRKFPKLEELERIGLITSYDDEDPVYEKGKKLQTIKSSKTETRYLVLSRLILNKLITLSGKTFRDTHSNLKHIQARLADGFTEADCEKVIKNRCAKWKDDPKMNEYLRPCTLFRPKHFEGYLNAPEPGTGRNGHNSFKENALEFMDNE